MLGLSAHAQVRMVVALACGSLLGGFVVAQDANPLASSRLSASSKPGPTRPFVSQNNKGPGPTIPPGTILAVRLNSTLSRAKAQPAQVITVRLMQDVPLPNGAKIRAGSSVAGRIEFVTRASTTANAQLSLQFDTLVFSHQASHITTNLRAIANVLDVQEAQIPKFGMGEGEVWNWRTIVLIGGDTVYGVGGPVTAVESPHEVVGKGLTSGVLVHVRAKPGTQCRGALAGDDSLQALWVFSSDACGVYGFDHLHIAHAGRTAPAGVVSLVSDQGELKIPAGTGLLLRISETGN